MHWTELLNRIGDALHYIARKAPDDDDDDDDDDDTRDILCSIQDAIERTERLNTQLRAELQHKAMVPRDFGNVLVLWTDAETKAPRCMSRTVRLSGPSGTEHAVEIPAQRPLPAGAWIVALNCEMRAVYAGTDAVDMGPAPRGRLVVLSNQIEIGSLLRLIVVAEK